MIYLLITTYSIINTVYNIYINSTIQFYLYSIQYIFNNTIQYYLYSIQYILITPYNFIYTVYILISPYNIIHTL